jgi:hypothetical protein
MANRRVTVFALVVAGSVAAASAAVGVAVLGAEPTAPVPKGPALTKETAIADTAGDGTGAPRAVMFRRFDFDRPRLDGRVAVRFLDGRRRTVTTDLHCRRVHAAAGRGLCVIEQRAGLALRALVLDDRLRVRHSIGLTGVVSRARVSPDGRYGAVTTFVSGHSYASPGQFSTATVLIDMATGKKIANLEQFEVTRDGEVVDAPDVNFWGVTFAKDSDRFYATLATGGKTYLIEGRMSTRTARTLRENVECPSLSPDGTRIAFKKLVGDAGTWRIHVLDLASLRDAPVADDRTVDDQVEWLDDRTVLYGASQQVWATPADGSGAPRRYIAQAESPAVLR